jgi:hypothetical protein|tara:strand:- start:94 stop:237 length:144 start_codon:yes stop_codon:yes gene_type:complete
MMKILTQSKVLYGRSWRSDYMDNMYNIIGGNFGGYRKYGVLDEGKER